MLSSRFKPWHVPLFLAKYAWLGVTRRPVLVHFEVTMRCNARCGFCDYWKTPSSERENETERCAAAARFFNPMLVTFTGGEPLLRKDLEDLVASVRDAIRLKYITLITHGGMLTPERGRSLWDAGVSQFNISLDYVDGRHDAERGIPGLTKKILATASAMRSGGINAIRFNTVIKKENIDHLPEVVRVAQELGVGVNFSVYTDFKNGNRDHLVQDEAVDRAEDGHRRAARAQASPARRHHELRLLPRADSALPSRRVDGAVSLRDPDDSHRSIGAREAVSRLSHRLPLARLQAVRAYRVQSLLLCVPWRSAGAFAALARARRHGETVLVTRDS